MKKFQIIQILMLVVFFLGVGSQALSAPQGLAQDAYDIFEQNCLRCHGSGGIAAAILLIEDYSALIAKTVRLFRETLMRPDCISGFLEKGDN